jgi:hypothetical protein
MVLGGIESLVQNMHGEDTTEVEVETRQDDMEDNPAHESAVTRAWASMCKSRVRTSVALGIVGAALSATLIAPLPISHDSINFVLALEHYDVTLHQPHPPGYFLYIMLGRLVQAMVGDGWTALWLLGIIGVGLAVAFTVRAGWEVAPGAGVAAGVIALSSPLLLSSAARGETHALACALSAFIGWRVLKLRLSGQTSVNEVIAISVAMAVLSGLRPSDALFLVPLWAYGVLAPGWRGLMIGITVGAFGTVSWLLPMVSLQPGGLPAIRHASSMLSSGFAAHFSPFVSGWSALRHNSTATVVALIAVVGPGWLAAPFLPRLRGRIPTHLVWVFAAWTIPAVLFCVLGHIGKAYYLLSISAALWLIGGITLATGLHNRKELVPLILAATVMALGFVVPIRIETNRLMRAWQAAASLVSELPADQTVALAPNVPKAPEGALAWDFRHTMYLAPHMLTVLFPLDSTAEWADFNAGRDRLTFRLPPQVELPGIRYILLPGTDFLENLPAGARLQDRSAESMKLYVVPVDPTEPLILGPGRRIEFRPAKTALPGQSGSAS